MILTPAQQRCFNNGVKACRDVLPKLEWLERVAEKMPEVADQVKELREMHDHLSQLCGCALALDA